MQLGANVFGNSYYFIDDWSVQILQYTKVHEEKNHEFLGLILKCSDGSYYTGHTYTLEKRIGEHQSGSCEGYTSTRLPVELVFFQNFPTHEDALASERQIKGWSRKKKKAMMSGDWNEVSRLAKRAK